MRHLFAVANLCKCILVERSRAASKSALSEITKFNWVHESYARFSIPVAILYARNLDLGDLLAQPNIFLKLQHLATESNYCFHFASVNSVLWKTTGIHLYLGYDMYDNLCASSDWAKNCIKNFATRSNVSGDVLGRCASAFLFIRTGQTTVCKIPIHSLNIAYILYVQSNEQSLHRSFSHFLVLSFQRLQAHH